MAAGVPSVRTGIGWMLGGEGGGGNCLLFL